MQEPLVTLPAWESWLARWNRELLDRIDLPHQSHLIQFGITPELIASGWLGYPGATEGQIAGLEARLGKALPPSYRAFLRTSNGFRQPGMIIPRILPVDEVEWFRERNQSTIDIWKDSENLSDTLEISAHDIDGSAVYLLNPKVVTADGEWEALYFATWNPGADRYSSFPDLMQKEYRYSVFYAERGKGRLLPEDDPQMIVVKFPNLVKDLERKMRSLAESEDPSDPDWSNDALEVLKAAESRLIEIQEKDSQPEIIHQQLRALRKDFGERLLARVDARRESGLYLHNRRDGFQDGYMMASASIRWFLGAYGT
jgi:hypothetical protein